MRDGQSSGGVVRAPCVTDSRARRGSLGAELRRMIRENGRKLVFVGNYGNGNLGDDAILLSILDVLGGDADVTVLTNDPELITARYGAKAAQFISVDGLRAIIAADVVCVGGGGIFGNGMKVKTELLALVMLALQKCGKNTAFVAIGAYSSCARWVQRALRRAAQQSVLVTARDSESAEVLGDWDGTVIVDDPAVDLVPASLETAREILTAAGLGLSGDRRPILGIALKPTEFGGRNRLQVRTAIWLANWWGRERGGEVALLCFSARGDNGLEYSVTDRSLSEDVVAAVDRGVVARIIGPEIGPKELKAVVGQLDAVVGHRLHAQIFAWSCGVPTAGLSYERKADAFLVDHRIPRFDLWEDCGAGLLGWLGQLDIGRDPSPDDEVDLRFEAEVDEAAVR
jgi:polysaccharide pyruvyl transferase WcaK-like protein